MITINKYLDDILFDFKEYVTSGVRLCDLKEVHFDAGILPDYSDIHVQQLYLLRYAYAYSFEYKRMYASLIRRMNPGMEIAVTSIGCGSMIDYWALTRVVPNRCTIRYRGIDTIDWSYRMEQRPQDDVLFRNADAVELVSKAKRLTADAYIFPKSISEFSKSDIEEICRCRNVTGKRRLRRRYRCIYETRRISGCCQSGKGCRSAKAGNGKCAGICKCRSSAECQGV